MIHKFSKCIQCVGNVPKIRSEAKFPGREQINWSKDSDEDAVDDVEEDGVVTADESHEGQPLLVLIVHERVDAIHKHVILQDKEDWEDGEKSGHRKFIIKVDWCQLGEDDSISDEEWKVLEMREDRGEHIQDYVREHD